MIPKQNRPLFKSVVCAVLSASLLIGFFVYALVFERSFFTCITLTQLLVLIVLLVFRQRFIARQAESHLQHQDYIEQSNVLRAGIRQEHAAAHSLRAQIVSYRHLKDLTEKLSLCLSLVDTAKTLSTAVVEFFANDEIMTMLYRFHSDTGELGLSFSQKGTAKVNIKLKKGDVFDEWVLKTMQPLLIENTRSDFRFDIDKVSAPGTRPIGSLISVPLMIGNQVLGILRLDSAQEHAFTTEDLRFLKTIGDLGAVALENAQLYERIEDLAIKDGLTGLYLRRYLLSRMSEEISRQLRRQKQLSFLMLDLDRFKNYNDTFGHMAGDIVLKTVAMILQDSFQQPGNLVSRYGGEEFAVLLPDCPKEKAVALAEEVRKKIKKQEIVLRKQKTSVTVSIGVATFPTDAQIKDDLIYMADAALYAAKSQGRDRVCAAAG